MRVGVVGINHKLADLKLREQLAKACQRRFGAINSVHLDHRFVLLSTCNRTEVYFASDDLAVTHSYLLNILRQEVYEEFEQKLYSYFGIDCFSHLSRVTAGLDSAIVAETEIQGQVKSAYEVAMHYSSLPADLHYMFQKSLKIGKDVRSRLQLGRGMPNLEHAILQIGSHFFSQFQHVRILFVGASEINQKILHFFVSKAFENITLCNRSQEAASNLAEKLQIPVLEWENFSQWHEYDCIIFGTKAPEYLLRRELLPEKLNSKKLVIDLCVPRNVEPNVGRNSQITLLNIDQINRTLQIRKTHMTHTLKSAETLIASAAQKQTSLFLEKESKRQRLLAIGS